MTVNATKSGYVNDTETFMIYIDPPAVEYTAIPEHDTELLAYIGFFTLIGIGPIGALSVINWNNKRKK